MCNTVHNLLQTVVCGFQMIVRVFMTSILMVENIIRLVMQTLYNFLSFMLQLFSLIPICVVFMVTARLKCFMCGGGGGCPVNRGGACDCFMSAIAIVIVFFVFRSTGILDKILSKLGYAKTIGVTKFVPRAGSLTDNTLNGLPSSKVSVKSVSRRGSWGEEEFEELEDSLRMGEPEPEEVEETEKITETKMLNYTQTGKPDEKTEPEGDKKLEEKRGPDKNGEPEEEVIPEKKEEPEEKGKYEEKEKREDKGKAEDKGKPQKKEEHDKKGKPEKKEETKENEEPEKKIKFEKEKSKALRKGAFKVNKKQNDAFVLKFLNSNIETTVVYYLV